MVLSIVKHMKTANLSCSVEECNPMNGTRERPGDIYVAEFDFKGHGPEDAFFDISVIHLSISVQRAISEEPRWDSWREAIFGTMRKC